MVTLRLILIAGLLTVAANALGQADLQIVNPACNQYSDMGIPCATCQCPRVYDNTQSPCNTLSYGTVEVGLTRTLSVIVANSAPSSAITPNVQLSVKLEQSGLADNRAYWQILSGVGTDLTPDAMNPGSFIVTPIPHRVNMGDPAPTKEIKIKFKPDLTILSTGALPVLLRVTVTNTDDWCYQDVDDTTPTKLDVFVTLSGTAIRTKIHSVMVLDRSGSMSTIVAPTTNSRYDLLKTSSKYFVDLVRTRNNSDDQLGAVWFDDQFGDLVPLRSSTTANLDNTWTTIDTSPDLQPRGSTAIGAGLQSGDVMIGTGMPNPAPDGKNLIILFTDGEENTGPPWMAAGSPTVAYVNNPFVYTIGMGSDINSPAQMSLSTYATNHQGSYYYVPETTTYSGTLPTALQNAFLKIYTDQAGMQGVVDPVVDVPLTKSESLVGSAMITSSDRNALFSVFERSIDSRYFDLEIRSPIGEVVKNGSLPSGILGSVKNEAEYAIYFVDFSKASSSSFVGKWDLFLKPKVKDITNAPKVVPIGFAVTVFSDLKLNAGIASTNILPGSEIKIALDFTESDVTISSVKDILVQLTMPMGGIVDLKVQKDQYGKWVAQYPHTYQAGTYQIFVRAKLQNSKGELTTRELTKHIALSYPSPGLANPVCVPCRWTKVIIIVAILLLLVILVRVYSIRKK